MKAFAVELCNVESIHPYPDNPRKSDAAIKPVAASLLEFGFRQPIVVDANHVIIVGHARYYAALDIGMTTVPVHVAADLSPAQARAYRIIDNRTNEFSEWDFEKLESELAQLQGDDYSIDSLACMMEDLEKCVEEAAPELIPEFAPADVSSQPRLDRKKSVACPECGHVFVPN